MITLHSLKKHPKSTRRKKVVGRGRGSGHGKYSTRGGKGQTARTGHSKMPVGFEGGRQPLKRQLPKNRGFQSPRAKAIAVSLAKLSARMPKAATITLASLKEAGLVPNFATKVKLVGSDKISVAYEVRVPATAPAKQQIEAAGGTVKK
jgi:large subunit ribosomal protein L15